MERIAFQLKLKDGKLMEYKARHDNIWPDMIHVLNEAGIKNYTIWNSGENLFGYYEVADSHHSNSVLASSPVIERWNQYMDEVIEYIIDEKTGTMTEMTKVFEFNLNQ
jgi:L-rhamnose mutarotase